MAARKHLLLFDGDHFVNRYFYGTASMAAIEAISFALGRHQRNARPSSAVMVFDSETGTRWRREVWPEYKANRPPKPDGLRQLFVDTRQQCKSWRLPWVMPAGIEGDDMIASYTEAAVAQGFDVTIVSGDKDLLQLVRDAPTQVRMLDELRTLNNVRGVTWDPELVRERWRVRPDQIADYLALVGDTSDGYPGVPRIGPKTALQLLEEYGTLDCLLANKNLVRSTRVMKLLREHEEIARLCYRLATLVRDVPLPIRLDRLQWSN